MYIFSNESLPFLHNVCMYLCMLIIITIVCVHLQCDLVLDAAHRKSSELSVGPRREDIVESIIFKASDVVVVHFKDMDLSYAKKGEISFYWQHFAYCDCMTFLLIIPYSRAAQFWEKWESRFS